MEETRGHDRVSGTRDEIVAALEERAEGWHRMASDRKADRAREAAQSVRDGSFCVKVGNTLYNVTEDAVPTPREPGDESQDTAVS
ncbi:hypothetical protein ACGFYT_29885 [Streptomyces sp. NPDC048208]|uniref:hypothetical protein n=1 Tax=Streptomyces sp. NPDC048208 TaxID=3365515 RepID=UPI00371525A8